MHHATNNHNGNDLLPYQYLLWPAMHAPQYEFVKFEVYNQTSRNPNLRMKRLNVMRQLPNPSKLFITPPAKTGPQLFQYCTTPILSVYLAP